MELGYEDVPALQRILYMLSSLKDQYASVVLALPADLPLNRLLRESQIPHKSVVHATAECRPYTRMQVKVLDHKALLESMTALPPDRRGSVIVGVHEAEGNATRFAIDFADGRAAVSPADAAAQFECRDTIWAAIALGEMPASRAVELGLATCTSPAALTTLEAPALGPTPFCNEPF
jgi:hypothetical protein